MKGDFMSHYDYGEPLKRGSANVWKRGEPVRGKMYLLERALIHQQEGYHLRPEEVIIELKDIKDLQTKNFFGIIPNGLVITTHDGEETVIVINRRKKWIEDILEAKRVLEN